MLRKLWSSSGPALMLQGFGMRIATVLIWVSSGILTARCLGPAGRGEQAALTLFPILVAGISSLGLPSALTWACRRHADATVSFYAPALLSALAISSLAAAIGALVLPHAMLQYKTAVVSAAMMLMIFAPAIALANVSRSYLQSTERFKISYGIQLGAPAGTLAILICLAWAGQMRPISSALAYFIPGALTTLWLLWHLRAEVFRRIHISSINARSLFGFALRDSGYEIITSLSAQVDTALIFHFLTPQALGLYVVSFSFSRLVALVDQSVGAVLFPRSLSLSALDAIPVIARAARITGLAGAALGAFLAGSVSLVVPLFYGHSFDGAFILARILIVEAVLAGVTGILFTGLASIGRPLAGSVLSAIWLFTAIAGLIVLLPVLSVVGAALALLIASALRLALTLATFRLLKSPVPSLSWRLDDFRFLRDRLLST